MFPYLARVGGEKSFQCPAPQQPRAYVNINIASEGLARSWYHKVERRRRPSSSLTVFAWKTRCMLGSSIRKRRRSSWHVQRRNWGNAFAPKRFMKWDWRLGTPLYRGGCRTFGNVFRDRRNILANSIDIYKAFWPRNSLRIQFGEWRRNSYLGLRNLFRLSTQRKHGGWWC